MGRLTVKGNDLGTGGVILQGPNTATPRTLTLPDATDTLVGLDTTQTLTNKTISGGASVGMEVQGGGITDPTQSVTTSGTTIDITGIPSWVKRIVIMFNQVSTNNTSPLLLQLGTISGIQTSGYVSSAVSTTTAATSTAGFNLQQVGVAAQTVSGHVILTKLSDAPNWVASGVLMSSTGIHHNSAGAVGLTEPVTQLRLTTVLGTPTFDNGSIRVQYEG